MVEQTQDRLRPPIIDRHPVTYPRLRCWPSHEAITCSTVDPQSEWRAGAVTLRVWSPLRRLVQRSTSAHLRCGAGAAIRYAPSTPGNEFPDAFGCLCPGRPHAPAGVAVECYLNLAALPHFNPDDNRDPLPSDVAALRSAIASADAVLFCTPEYAGTLPGSLKNLLDWSVGGTELTAKPVAWVKVAADPRRGEGAHATLGTVLGYVQAKVIPDACREVPITRDAVGPDGLITDPTTRSQITATIQALLETDPSPTMHP
jgi:chromate reductase